MRRRFAHALKDNQTTETPKHVIFFDTETVERTIHSKAKRLELRLGVACYTRYREVGRNDSHAWLDFGDSRVFWDWVFSKCRDRTRVYLVAHNVVFDIKVTKGFAALRGEGFVTRKIIVNGTSNIWEFRKGTRSIVVLDNMNFFKTSLADLGDAIGIPKMEMPAEDSSVEAWATYCRRDVEVMRRAWELWLSFIKVHDLGTFGKTLASQAMNAYRHRFMPHTIYIHDAERAIALERESYHGGRTECFFIGKMPDAEYHVLDVNSMYPSVMKEHAYPKKLIKFRDNVPLREFRRLLTHYCLTAEVDLDVTEPVFSTRQDNRLIFPIGRFTTSLTTRELAYAQAKGWIKKVKRTAIYEKAKLFERYVDFFYARRLEYKNAGNEPFAYMCKLLLNSLYGKFGQRNEVFEKVGVDSDAPDGIARYYDLDLQRWVTRRTINGVVEESQGQKEGFNSFVAVAAHITADARVKLWEIIKKAGRSNVFYCDTDSIFTNNEGKDRTRALSRPRELGYLSTKGSSRNLEIFGPKDYVFGEARTLKGIRSDAKRITETKFEQLKFEGFAGALRNGRLDEMILETVEKSLSREYKKGIVQSNGHVRPIELRGVVDSR